MTLTLKRSCSSRIVSLGVSTFVKLHRRSRSKTSAKRKRSMSFRSLQRTSLVSLTDSLCLIAIGSQAKLSLLCASCHGPQDMNLQDCLKGFELDERQGQRARRKEPVLVCFVLMLLNPGGFPTRWIC